MVDEDWISLKRDEGQVGKALNINHSGLFTD